MSEFKGTPGRWELAHRDVPQLRVMGNNGTEDVCECLDKYDALLISNAPELWDALRDTLDLLMQLNIPDDLFETFGNLMMNNEELLRRSKEL